MRCLSAAARVVASVSLLGALAGLTAHTAAAAPHATQAHALPSNAPACTARQLRAAVESSSGAAGMIVLRIGIRNTATPCALAGHPSLRLGMGPEALPTRTVRGGLALLEAEPNAVELSTRDRAYLLVVYNDRPAGAARDTAATGGSSCPDATHIDIRVPGWQRVLRVRVKAMACNGGLLRTSPFLHAARPVRSSGTTTATAAPAPAPAGGVASGASFPGDL